MKYGEIDLNILAKWSANNEMKVNIKKCGVMHVRAKVGMAYEFTYENEPLPGINDYIYLGSKFNCNLDSDVMAKFRVGNGMEKLKKCHHLLANNLIPIQFKKAIIRSIIVPSVSFGSEIYGMSEARSAWCKSVIDRSLGAIVKKK